MPCHEHRHRTYTRADTDTDTKIDTVAVHTPTDRHARQMNG